MEIKLNPSNVLSAGAEKLLTENIEELKATRDGVELMQGVDREVKDKAMLNKRIAEYENIRQTQSLPQLSGEERDRAATELKALQADLQKGMPTWDEYISSRPRDGASHPKIVAWIIASEKDAIRRQKIARWKVLRRLMNPDDPQASNTMYLFPID